MEQLLELLVQYFDKHPGGAAVLAVVAVIVLTAITRMLVIVEFTHRDVKDMKETMVTDEKVNLLLEQHGNKLREEMREDYVTQEVCKIQHGNVPPNGHARPVHNID